MAAVNPSFDKSPLEKWIIQKIGGNSGSLIRKDLEDYQLKKLQATLSLVKAKSPFYQQKLLETPETIVNLGDWQNLPFTTAEELKTDGLKMVTVSQGNIHRVVTLDTSGTSGSPKRCFFTKKDQSLTIDFFGIGMTSLASVEDNVLILLPCERPGSVGDLLHEGLKQQKISSIKYGAVDDINKVMTLIHEQKITCLVGAPKQVLALARWSSVLGLSIPNTIRSVLLSTDHLPQAIAQSLVVTWGCKVFNHYGMTEMGLGGGVDCQAHYGMHLREADLFFEIIDIQTGELVPDGEFGEVVFTTLTREGMPFIRYRTGDISRFLPIPCPCRSNLKTMDWIKYRHADTIKHKNGEISLADFDEVLFAIPEVLDFKVIVSNTAPLYVALQINTNKSSVKKSTILDSLLSIPALEKAFLKHELEINIKLTFGLPDKFSSLAKRKIQFVPPH